MPPDFASAFAIYQYSENTTSARFTFFIGLLLLLWPLILRQRRSRHHHKQPLCPMASSVFRRSGKSATPFLSFDSLLPIANWRWKGVEFLYKMDCALYIFHHYLIHGSPTAVSWSAQIPLPFESVPSSLLIIPQSFGVPRFTSLSRLSFLGCINSVFLLHPLCQRTSSPVHQNHFKLLILNNAVLLVLLFGQFFSYIMADGTGVFQL